MHQHDYRSQLVWDGDRSVGTTTYEAYSRDFRVLIDEKPDLLGSAAPIFRGDGARHDPEDWLLAAIAGCHMLAYLALCARAAVVVLAYSDDPIGTLEIGPHAGGRFTKALLRPHVTVQREDMVARAREFHARAHSECFVAQSVRFPVAIQPIVDVSLAI